MGHGCLSNWIHLLLVPTYCSDKPPPGPVIPALDRPPPVGSALGIQFEPSGPPPVAPPPILQIKLYCSDKPPPGPVLLALDGPPPALGLQIEPSGPPPVAPLLILRINFSTWTALLALNGSTFAWPSLPRGDGKTAAA